MRAAASVSVLGVALFITAVMSGGAACSDDPAPAAPADASTEGGAILTVEAENFLKSVCSLYEPCCAKASKTASDTCLGATAASARGKPFDSARAKSCLAALNEESKKKIGSFCTRSPDAPSCAAVFKIANAKAPGSACKLSEECANEGDADGVCLSQKCHQVKRGKAGDACLGTRINGTTDVRGTKTSGLSICLASDNIYCDDTDAANATCKPRSAVGATCTFGPGGCIDTAWCPDTKQCALRSDKGVACMQDDECAAGFRCIADDTGDAKCVALEIEGGTCIRGDECDPRDGLICDSSSTKCTIDASLFGTACLGSLPLL